MGSFLARLAKYLLAHPEVVQAVVSAIEASKANHVEKD